MIIIMTEQISTLISESIIMIGIFFILSSICKEVEQKNTIISISDFIDINKLFAGIIMVIVGILILIR